LHFLGLVHAGSPCAFAAIDQDHAVGIAPSEFFSVLYYRWCRRVAVLVPALPLSVICDTAPSLSSEFWTDATGPRNRRFV
jgi:hypothetical protein